MNLKGKHFINLEDFSKDDILGFLDLAEALKKDVKEKKRPKHPEKQNACYVLFKTEFENKNKL